MHEKMTFLPVYILSCSVLANLFNIFESYHFYDHLSTNCVIFNMILSYDPLSTICAIFILLTAIINYLLIDTNHAHIYSISSVQLVKS